MSSEPNPAGELVPDLFILSDLHLSAGVSPETQRTSRLETFFYDREFANLVDRVIVNASARRRPTILLLNGDIFDFLAVVQVPPAEERARLGLTLTRRERKYGMDSEPAKDAWKMRRIVRGHPEFLSALLRFVACGHVVHLNRGNHDVELFWPEVREAFYEEVTALAAQVQPRLSAEQIRDGVRFHEWFYYEPGRIWVEHGHQYEASNSFRYLLSPTIVKRRSAAQQTLDLPTGSQFVRYVYNRFKLVDPYSTQVFTLEQYLDIISRYNVVDLAKALLVHFPFFVRALKDARVFELSGVAEAAVVHHRRLDALGRESGLGETLKAVDDFRSRPIGGTKYSLFREMMKPIVRSLLTVVLLALVSIGGWMLLFSLIQNTQWLAESVLGKASLMAVLAVVTIVGLFAGGVWMSRRYQHAHGTLQVDLTGLAERLCDTLGVPIVAFGHSHGVDRRRLAGDRIYANSGTWTVVRGPWDAVRPFGRQFTFLYVHERTVEALRWHDAAGRWEPVTFLEDHEPTHFERLLGGDSDGGPFG